MNQFLILLISQYFTLLVKSDNFLIIHPFYSGSHVLTLHHVSEALISKGHKVVTLRFQDCHQFKFKSLGPNHREIVLTFDNEDGSLSPLVSKEKEGKFAMPVELLWQEGLSLSTIFKVPNNPWSVVQAYCHQILSNKTLHDELKSEHFDVTIVDLIYNECGLALAREVIETPVMAYWAFSFSGGEAEFTTMATPPSHVPCFMSEVSDQMQFHERMWNTALKFSFQRLFILVQQFVVDHVISQYFPNCPSASFLIADLNGAMINTNFVLDYPRLQPTTFINVGGMQISKKPKLLPEDIKTFMEDENASTHGVILFTMGFIFNPKAVPESRIKAIFEAFAQLPQKVIMKFDPLPPESTLKVPTNVLLKSFLPQQDILAHKNTILFITHCGMHGVMESIYHEVPMVGMPVAFDQGDVLTRIEEKGIGIGISKWASSDIIVNAVKTVLNDTRFMKNIKELSQLMKIGMKEDPMNHAIWWLEYLSATKGANHLKLSSRHLNFIQYFSLDFIFIILIFFYFISKFLIRQCCSGSKKSKFKTE